jgi:predicted nuclease of predicted toxin-antitoxin system
VRTVADEGLRGSDDVAVLRRAHAMGRVVVTHDADFGKLAIQAGEPYTGIVFLRPGHISPSFVLGALAALEASSINVIPPFIAVIERKVDHVRVRVRSDT